MVISLENLQAILFQWPEKVVRFDFGAYPSEIISWRGDYVLPSLSNSQEPITAKDLAQKLEEVLNGKQHRGYKGGFFQFRPHMS